MLSVPPAPGLDAHHNVAFGKVLKIIHGVATVVGNLDHVLNWQTHRLTELLEPGHAAPPPAVPAATRRLHIGTPSFLRTNARSEQTRSFDKLNVASDRRNDTVFWMRRTLMARRQNEKEEITISCAQPL